MRFGFWGTREPCTYPRVAKYNHNVFRYSYLVPGDQPYLSPEFSGTKSLEQYDQIWLFSKVLATIFIIKYFWKALFKHQLQLWFLFGQQSEKLGYFLFQHLVTLYPGIKLRLRLLLLRWIQFVCGRQKTFILLSSNDDVAYQIELTKLIKIALTKKLITYIFVCASAQYTSCINHVKLHVYITVCI